MIKYPKTQEDAISLLQNADVRIEYFPSDGTYCFNSNDLYEVLKFIQACLEQQPEEESNPSPTKRRRRQTRSFVKSMANAPKPKHNTEKTRQRMIRALEKAIKAHQELADTYADQKMPAECEAAREKVAYFKHQLEGAKQP